MKETPKAKQAAARNAGRAADAFDDAKDRLSGMVDDAKDAGQELLDKAKDRGNELLQDARDRGEDAFQDLRKWAGKNPGAAVGYALAAGVVLYVLFSRDD